MRKVSYGLIAIFGLLLISCAGEEPQCEETSIENWDSFLGINYKDREYDLETSIGPWSGGEYISDSSAFIYYFDHIDRVKLSVWVNGDNGVVQTIFMEILSYEENFDEDLQLAIDKFNIKECESRFFGMKKEEVIEVMGEPQDQRGLEDGVESISYDSEGYKYMVSFKFYESQANMCTSIMVNWFY